MLSLHGFLTPWAPKYKKNPFVSRAKGFFDSLPRKKAEVKKMRDINLIIIHCTATQAKRDVYPADLHQWHVIDNQWAHIGYHYLIQRCGITSTLLKHEQPGIHAKGHNAHSIGIALAGGVDKNLKPENNFTPAQWAELDKLLRELEQLYPGIHIIGHNQVSSKACPSFDVEQYLIERRRRG